MFHKQYARPFLRIGLLVRWRNGRRKHIGNVEVDETHKQFKCAKVTGSNPVLATLLY